MPTLFRGPAPLPGRGDEPEGRRVQAVAQAGGRRAVGKHVTEVAVTPPAADLGADHPGTRVADGSDVIGIERLEEAGPARARLELRLGPEERQAAQPARVRARGGAARRSRGPEEPAEGQADPLALKPGLTRHAVDVVTLARPAHDEEAAVAEVQVMPLPGALAARPDGEPPGRAE